VNVPEKDYRTFGTIRIEVDSLPGRLGNGYKWDGHAHATRRVLFLRLPPQVLSSSKFRSHSICTLYRLLRTMAFSLLSVLVAILPLVSAQGCPFSLAKRQASNEPSLTTLADSFGQCATISDAGGRGTRSRDWWPCQLKLDVLRQFSPEQNPLGASFDYIQAFSTLNCKPRPDIQPS
jgi:hypothetical protein